MSTPVRVMVVDDQALVREGLMTLLAAAPDVEPVAAAVDGEEAVALCARLAPDVVLMDLRMPRLDGVQATRRILAAQPMTEIVVLTTHADETSILDALRAGARGYLKGRGDRRDLPRRAGRCRASGGPRPGRARPPARGGQRRRDRAAVGQAPIPGGRAPTLPDELTPREAEVLSLVARGLSNGEIAATLVVSQATVKTHINHLFSKIGARDRAQAVHYAYTHGLAG